MIERSENPVDRRGWQGLDEWRGALGRRWADASATADAQFAPLSDATYLRLAPLDGCRVLDVGCGSGGTTAALAELVGPSGSVTGIDASADVLAVARTRGDGGRITLLEGDAQRQAFPDAAFDVVFSRLGVMFFEDPPAAFANLHRATVAGGRLGFSCWPTRERCPSLIAPLRALVGVVELPASAPAGSPNPFSLGEPASTRELLRAAGWRNVELHEVCWVVDLAADAATAAAQWLNSIPVTLVVRNPEPETRAAMLAALQAALPASRQLEQRGLIVTATA